MKLSISVMSTVFFITFVSANCSFGQIKKDKKTETATSSWKKIFEIPCDDGLGNFTVLKSDALRMKKHFDEIYRLDDRRIPINSLVESAWIDRCIIENISRYLENTDGYDGLRIYFGAEQNESEIEYPGERFKNKTMLILVPTTENGDKHSDVWGKIIPMGNCKFSFKYFNMEYAVSNPLINKFGEVYREEKMVDGQIKANRDSLTKSVWICKSILSKLLQILDAGNDGIRIYPMAYFEKSTNYDIGQLYKNQSSLVFVPTRKKDLEHQDDWYLIPAYILKHLKNPAKRPIAVLNHGELCPDKCP